MHVIHQREIVFAPPTFHHDRFVAVAEEPSPHLVPRFEAPRGGVLQPLHAGDEIRLWRFKHEVVVIVQQDPGMNLPPRLLTSLAQPAHEKPAIDVIAKDGLTPIAPRQDVVKSSRILETKTARHLPGAVAPTRPVKIC